MNVYAKLIAVVSVLCLCGCTGTSSDELDLTGRWLTDDHTWGLEFREAQVFEWEGEEIQNEGAFTLTKVGNAFALVVDAAGNEPVVFRLEPMKRNQLLLTAGEERVELKKQ